MAPSYHVIISPRAASDLGDIHANVELDSPQNARSILSELIDAIDSLQHLPRRYRAVQGRRRPSKAVRRMPVPPYLIYYRIEERKQSVEIITVRHGARRQPRRF
jgi:plasmid stabilization system protein ParE